MMGSATKLPDGTISREIPESHPAYNWMWVVSCELLSAEGHDGTTWTAKEFIQFQEMVYRVNYASLPYEVVPDGIGDDPHNKELNRYVERRKEFSAEHFQLPSNAMWWTQVKVEPLQEGVPKAMHTSNWIYVWHRVPSYPETRIIAALGKVNSIAFDTTEYNARPQTLLLVGAAVENLHRPRGKEEFRITYQFMHRDNGDDDQATPEPAGWNHFYRPGQQEWQLITHNGNVAGRRIYETYDFHNLFKLD